MFKSLFAAISNFFKNLFHKNKTVTQVAVTPVPTTIQIPIVSSPEPVVAAPSPAPVPTQPVAIAPTPSAPTEPVKASLPDGVLEIDDRGFCKLKAIEDQRATDPLWATAYTWYAIELDNYPVSFIARSNLTEAKTALFLGVDANYDKSHTNTAFQVTPADPSKSFGYKRGTPYLDAISFIGDNRDQNNNITYKGIRPNEVVHFVAQCSANLKAAKANNSTQPNSAFLPIPREG